MRKIAILLTLLLSATALSAQRDLYMMPRYSTEELGTEYNIYSDFLSLKNNNRITIGAAVSAINGVRSSAVTFNVFGAHFDYHSNTEGNHVRNLGVDNYDGYNAISWHIGYSIPITPHFSITPLVGKVNYQEGYYNGSNWGVDDNGIVNEWVSVSELADIDFGAKATLDILDAEYLGIAIFATLTAYTYSGGFELIFYFNGY